MEFGSRLALTFRENICHFPKRRCVATLLRMHTRVRVVAVALLSLSRDQCVFYESDFLLAKRISHGGEIPNRMLSSLSNCNLLIYFSLCLPKRKPPRTLVSCNFKFSMACCDIEKVVAAVCFVCLYAPMKFTCG